MCNDYSLKRSTLSQFTASFSQSIVSAFFLLIFALLFFSNFRFHCSLYELCVLFSSNLFEAGSWYGIAVTQFMIFFGCNDTSLWHNVSASGSQI